MKRRYLRIVIAGVIFLLALLLTLPGLYQDGYLPQPRFFRRKGAEDAQYGQHLLRQNGQYDYERHFEETQLDGIRYGRCVYELLWQTSSRAGRQTVQRRNENVQAPAV